MSFARTNCACCGDCPVNCEVCLTTTGETVGGGCGVTKPASAYDLTPYDCGSKPFNFAFTFGNNGSNPLCHQANMTGFNETPSHTSVLGACDVYQALNWYWSITMNEDWIFNGLAFDYEASGWKKFEQDGGGDDCDNYLYKLGSTTPSCCNIGSGKGAVSCATCGFSSFTVSAWAIGINSEGETTPRLTPVEVTDTDDYTAFTVSYQGDSDYVTVQVSVNEITFTWVGGTYDGTTCTIPITNEASIPANCINVMNKGITATNIADDFVGCCHALKIGTTNIASGGSTNVEYNKTKNTMYYRFAFEYLCLAHLGTGATRASDFEDVWDGTNSCDTPVLITPIETIRGMVWDSDDQLLDQCQCVSDLPFDQYYCANEYSLTREAYSTDPSGCIVSAPLDACGGSCNCFTTGETFEWT